jgi:hypothetical protein
MISQLRLSGIPRSWEISIGYGVGMSEEHQPGICCQCDLPLIELDACGERLYGCVGCNTWQALDSGEWRHLPDADIAALSGMVARWTKEAQR